MKKIIIFLILLSVLSILAGLGLRYRDVIRSKLNPPPQTLRLYGNVDDRQVNLSFIVSERIAEIKVEEGDVVHKGELLGTLETVRIENRIAEAKAATEAASANWEKQVNGYRQEEVAMAEAGVNIIKAQLNAAKNLYTRNKDLANSSAVSKQDADNAESNYNKLLAELDLAENNYKKMFSGSRKEDIAAAKANLEQSKAMLAIQQQNLKDTQLYAPCDGIVRSRIQEPGEMASPQTTALILAVVSPKWIRVYLSELLLPKIKPGDKAQVTIDGLTDTHWEGWVGYISPTAEFTPKNVETTELRTSLVYEMRIYVKDTENILKLGAPATVTFPEILVHQ